MRTLRGFWAWLSLPLQGRNLVLTLSVILAGICAAPILTRMSAPDMLPPALRWPTFDWVWYLAWTGLALFGFLALVGVRDLLQTKHSILRNYPIIAHLRFFFEAIRPEMRQYFFEDDKDGRPFSRDKRSLVYQRAKRALDKRPFGTVYDVYEPSFEWLTHSMAPKPTGEVSLRVDFGGPDCAKPYSGSILGVSGMSFGAISPNAILALNKAAKAGSFHQVTGEGGVSRYHRQHGGDLVWQLGSGYFGARNDEGRFDPDRFRETAALDQIKMIELKLSQGAKPGHGGVLPKAKITAEVSRTRGVPRDRDCVSPPYHPEFSTPIELLSFVSRLRELSEGKPIGLKLCVGHPWEFLAVCKAMRETGVTPDYIMIDGKEGGTGAAPLEFADHIGMPLRDGLNFAHNALVGVGLRDRIRLGASGKIASGFDMARSMALGADFCHAARTFMFALGCIQAQSCHTDHCPTGVATTDPRRARALVVNDKWARVASYHHLTIEALAEICSAAGVARPQDLKPYQFRQRVSANSQKSFEDLYPSLAENELLVGAADPRFAKAWAMADPHSFEPIDPAGRRT